MSLIPLGGFCPMDREPAFPQKTMERPVSEPISSCWQSLPSYNGLRQEEQEDIVATIWISGLVPRNRPCPEAQR